MKLLGWICTSAVLQIASSAKILTILPMPVKSHSILFDRLIKQLAIRGHEITYITPFRSGKPTANITEIIIPDLLKSMSVKLDRNNKRALPEWLTMLITPWDLDLAACRIILEDPQVKSLIAADDNFDLIFGEHFFDEAVLAGFSYKYNAPIIILSTIMPSVWSNFLVGNPAPVSTTPNPFLAYTPPLTFLQRLANFAYTMLSDIIHRASLLSHNQMLQAHFGNDAPFIEDILRNTSLLLVNHHPTLSFARAQTPNTIDVAGMHIYPPKPLPKDLEDYMNNSKDGVILFSLGTNVKCSLMSKETIEGILRAFGRMKENILWKFDEELDNLPNNVRIEKWLPQSDILGKILTFHSRAPRTYTASLREYPESKSCWIKLFITHGGMLSTIEAVYSGVPIVGIPLIVDQPVNMQHTENAGLGITLVYEHLSEDTLYNAVTQVISNPRYREVAREKSRQLRDTPMPALETAVWWIEFVLRNHGAPQLKNPSRNLWWYERYLLDVFLALLALISATIAVSKFFITKTLAYFRQRLVSRNTKKGDVKKKN